MTAKLCDFLIYVNGYTYRQKLSLIFNKTKVRLLSYRFNGFSQLKRFVQIFSNPKFGCLDMHYVMESNKRAIKCKIALCLIIKPWPWLIRHLTCGKIKIKLT